MPASAEVAVPVAATGKAGAGSTTAARRAPVAGKCGDCKRSICCTYVTHRLDTPRGKADFDYLLWHVSHQGVSVYKDEDGWFLAFQSVCSHLQPGGGCGIYERRPQVCQEYSNDYCEFDASAEDGFELHFRDYDSLLRYCRARFKTWERR